MQQDPITLERIETAHPEVRFELSVIYAWICEKVNSQYCQIRFTWVLRTLEEQTILYNRGRTTPGVKVTNAKAGESFHNYGLAVDICLLIDRDKNGTFEEASWDVTFDGNKDGIADWLEVVKIFNHYGWQWGIFNKKGRRYDLPHFQKSFGYKPFKLKQMLKDINGYAIFCK